MFSFLNPWMLVGLAGLSLPIIAHLLSKRNYEVIHWGAMQFLELNPNLRRKMRLEELLLLLVRLLLIALIVIALSRLQVEGSFFGQVTASRNRDVVVIIDSSYSMGWEGEAKTPHLKAKEQAAEFLDTLRAGDAVTVIDARSPLRIVVAGTTPTAAKDIIGKLPAPSGTCVMTDALQLALDELAGGEHPTREVVLFTDNQRLPWKLSEEEDSVEWTRIADRLRSAENAPRVWVVPMGGASENASNYLLDAGEISREFPVRGAPLRIATVHRRSGGEGETRRTVEFHRDGSKVNAKTQHVPLKPGGEVSLEFPIREGFARPGSHVLSLVLQKDNLPGDNRLDFAISVRKPPRVLLVDGDPNPDPKRGETGPLLYNLTPPSNDKPWVQAEAVSSQLWMSKKLDDYDVIVLANVANVPKAQVEKLKSFVAAGGGLLFALGDKVVPDQYKTNLWEDGLGLLPALPEKIEEDKPAEDGTRLGEKVPDDGLQGSWLDRFRSGYPSGFTQAPFYKWWRVSLGGDGGEGDTVRVSKPIVQARFSRGDPFLVWRSYGKGSVALCSSPLDADWGNLPRERDYDFVPFVHELVFRLASPGHQRNVPTGSPIVFRLAEDRLSDGFVWIGPDGEERKPGITTEGPHIIVRLDDTALPGVYRFQHAEEPRKHPVEYFTATTGREESDLEPLTEEDRKQIAGTEEPDSKDARIRFVKPDALTSEMYRDESKSELWRLLLLFFVGILLVEAVMTRRLVKHGHADDRGEDEAMVLPIAGDVEAQASSRPVPRHAATTRGG